MTGMKPLRGFIKFSLLEMKRWEQLLCVIAALLLIAPGLIVTWVGAALATPVLLCQLAAWKLGNAAPSAA